MAQKIPFFELFSNLTLNWEQRVQLDSAYLTGAELDRENRAMELSVVVEKDLGEDKALVEAAIAQTYDLKNVVMHLKVAQPKQEAAAKSSDSEVVMGGVVRGAVHPMVGLNPKMGGVVVAGKVFFADLYETRKPGVFCLTFDMTDFQGSVRVTKYMQKEEKDAMKKSIKPGMWLKVQGYMKLNRDGSDVILDPRNISTYHFFDPRI